MKSTNLYLVQFGEIPESPLDDVETKSVSIPYADSNGENPPYTEAFAGLVYIPRIGWAYADDYVKTLEA